MGIIIFKSMENEVNRKVCNACLENKELSNFTKDSAMLDNLSNKCRKCQSEKRPSVRYKPTGELKICKVCEEEKDICYFYKRPDRSYSHEPRCISCTKEGKLVDNKVFLGDEKKCPTCQMYKKFDEYNKCGSCLNGIAPNCKKCSNIKKKEQRENTPKDVKKERKRKEYLKNRDGYLKRSRDWNENNKDKVRERRRLKERNLKYTDHLLYLKRNTSSLIRMSFNREIVGGCKKAKKTVDILGCTMQEFKNHIESQFESWMSWDNYGNCKTFDYKCSWHLDHIIPVSLAKNEEELYLLNHWSNFQPLCSKVNQNDKRFEIYPCTNLILKICSLDFK